MIKKLLIVFVLVFAIQMSAQEGGVSPYSYYGIGSLKFKGTVENRSMGGIGVYNDSIRVNLQNPATYTGKNMLLYNKETRSVIFSVGGSSNFVNLKSNSSSAKSSTQSFDYLSLSVPIGKVGLGFGLLPFTSVGYSLENFDGLGRVSERYAGEGGVNKTYVSIGYPVTESLAFGITGEYNFGKIKNSTILFPYDSDGNTIAYKSKESNRSDLSGLSFNLGAHYNKMVTSKLELQASTTFSPQANLVSKNERGFSTIILDAQNRELTLNELEADLAANNLDKTNLKLPTKFTIGAGIGEPRKWFAGVDFKTQNIASFSNPLYNYQNTSFENASTLAMGGFYIPKYNSFSSYFKRVTYRAGMRFEKTGLKINNESIREFGISFGLGLPVGATYSNANIGVEFGNRGTTNNNLIKENFINLQFSLSLNDRWFQKRKYD